MDCHANVVVFDADASFEQTTNVIWHDSSPPANTSKWKLRSAQHDHSYLGDNNGSFIVTNGPGLARLIADVQRLHVRMCSVRFWYLAHVCYNVSVSAHNHYGFPFSPVLMTHQWLAVPSTTWQRLEGVFMGGTFGIVSGVSIEAVPVGNGLNSQLVIDDIEFLPCSGFTTCSFERDICGWTVAVADSRNATWIRWYGNPPSFSSGLMTDHTRHSVDGYYLYVHVPVEGTGESIAVLRGIPLSPGFHVCGIKLWYYLLPHADGWSGSATLSVIFMSAGGMSVVVRSTEGSLQSSMDKWEVVEAEHRVMEEGHFQLKANVSNGGDGVQTVSIAVDDVTYIECQNTGMHTISSLQ